MEELISDPALILYSLSQVVAFLVFSLFEQIAEATDEATAVRIAREYGAKHGERNYRRFLENHGYSGGAKAFCEFQDYGHSLLGPKHASGLYAEYDEGEGLVVVKRTDCLYFWGERGASNKYLNHLEQGIAEGYAKVDPSFIRVENPKCLSLGNPDGCEHRVYFEV